MIRTILTILTLYELLAMVVKQRIKQIKHCLFDYVVIVQVIRLPLWRKIVKMKNACVICINVERRIKMIAHLCCHFSLV